MSENSFFIAVLLFYRFIMDKFCPNQAKLQKGCVRYEYILLVYHDILHGIGIEGGALLDFRHASFHASANYSKREKDDGKGYHSPESAATAFAAAEP